MNLKQLLVAGLLGLFAYEKLYNVQMKPNIETWVNNSDRCAHALKMNYSKNLENNLINYVKPGVEYKANVQTHFNILRTRKSIYIRTINEQLDKFEDCLD